VRLLAQIDVGDTDRWHGVVRRWRTGDEDHPDKVSPAHPPDTTMVAMDRARIRNGGADADVVGTVFRWRVRSGRGEDSA
jgi:hypothetical protein